MPTCANGAEPAPGNNSVNVALSLASAGLTLVPGLGEVAPWLLSNPVVGSASVAGICAANPDDPGDFNPSMLWPPPTINDFPAPTQPAGSLMRWLWDKTVYFHFQHSCICKVTNVYPPTPTPVTPITNYDTSVNNSNNRTQVTIIQNNQTDGADGQKLLYNMGQHISSLVGENWVRQAAQLVTPQFVLGQSLTGEGTLTLPVDEPNTTPWFSPQYLGLRTHVEALGPDVGIRGTLNPRLYGVGSLYFDAQDDPGGVAVIGSRQSIHYYWQTMRLPLDQITFRIHYRLMPGNVVTLWLYQGAQDNVIWNPGNVDAHGWWPFFNWQAPPNHVDPPIYPSAAIASAPTDASGCQCVG